MPDPTVDERHTRDQAVMAELRSNGGRMRSGQTLAILTITGAQSGQKHEKPVCVREDGPDLVVAASAGGQRRHPQWYRNLVVNRDVTVEYVGEAFQAWATTEPNGPDRDRLFQMMSVEIVGLYGYQDRCRDSRQIPIIRLARTS
jgi:deazaflavin-dependent oxidoreductase (nitroreductase family)